MKDFSLHHKTAGPAPAGFAPKPGELVSAKFSDGQWYRAKVKKSSQVKKEAQVTFIDYGNQDTIGFKDIRPLEQKFRSLPGQAHEARLRLVPLTTCVPVILKLGMPETNESSYPPLASPRSLVHPILFGLLQFRQAGRIRKRILSGSRGSFPTTVRREATYRQR